MNKIIIAGLVFLLITPTTGIVMNKSNFSSPSLYILHGSSDGRILYVGGSGPNNYTSIQAAIDAAGNGDTIFVYDDSSPYYENIVIDKSIVLIGENAQTTIIDGRSRGYVIQIKAKNVTVSNFKITHGGLGGFPEKGGVGIFSDYAKILNNIIVNNGFYGMQIYSSHNLIEGNKIHSHIWWGMYFERSSNNTIRNNTIYDSKGGLYFISSCYDNIIENNVWHGIEHAIDIYDSSRNIVEGNKLFDVSDGITISSTHNHIAYNNISHCCRSGIILRGDNNRIEGNVLSNCGYCGGFYGGMRVESRYSVIANNTFLRSGIIVYAYPNKFLNNTINGKPLIYIENKNGIKLDGGAGQIIAINCNNIEISNTSISHTSIGIQLINCNNCVLKNNNFSRNRIGIECNGSFNLLINNEITKNGDCGIWCDGSFNRIEGNNIISNGGCGMHATHHNIIRNNYIAYNEYIGLELSEGNIVENNTISFNRLSGIYLCSSTDNVIKHNDLVGNWEGISMDNGCNDNIIAENDFENGGISFYWWIINEMGHNEIYGNKINGKPLVYMENECNKEVEKAGQVILIKCENISVKNQTISNVSTGILLWKSKNCNISNNKIEHCNGGISIANSTQNFIYCNKISYNWVAISVYGSSCNIISRNFIKSNCDGIAIKSSNKNKFYLNHIIQNNWGIWLDNSKFNKFYGNKIKENGNASIIISSNFNKFIGNDFLDNNREIELYSFHNLWLRNYWDKWHIPLPKPIVGHLGRMSRIPWINFDWLPRAIPYKMGK